MAKNSKTILIASSGLDKQTWGPVADSLRNRGYKVLVYEADKVANGTVALTVRLDAASDLHIDYDGYDISPRTIAAAWYRRPSVFATEPATQNRTRQLSVNEERKAAQASIWDSLPAHMWLNASDYIQKADQKISQLRLAKEVGFTIPATVITNRWSSIRDCLPKDIILKMYRGVLIDENERKYLYTTCLTNTPHSLPIDTNPFPGYWQQNIPKSFEWRITVVGKQVFSAAIYTAENAKDDWRKHQYGDGSVIFKAKDFPEPLKKKCLRYLAKMNLKFGAFDFIESTDGRVIFLECNPNGQYYWLEKELGLPISNAIADELINIATSINR